MLFRLLLLIAAVGVFETTQARQTQSVPLESDRWALRGEGVDRVLYGGEQAFRMKGASIALEDVEFRTGTIEFDVAFSLERNFLGVFWGEQDPDNRQVFYFRPHQSGMPDANQYNPDIGGLAAWQLYHGRGYSTPTQYKAGEWQHVRVVVSCDYGEVYIDSDDPVLTFQLKGPKNAGSIGFYAGPLSTGYVSNFAYWEHEPRLASTFEPFDALPPGTITHWEVSDAFDEASLSASLPADFVSARTWRTVTAEEMGITPLSHPDRTGNTVLAKHRLYSENAGTAMFNFGYSDRVRVYLNGELLYTGNNGYQSRDYRYLGTIGLFDALPLVLQEGENELILAVSESFGGWGVMGQLLD